MPESGMSSRVCTVHLPWASVCVCGYMDVAKSDGEEYMWDDARSCVIFAGKNDVGWTL